jgi:hypothetical protein
MGFDSYIKLYFFDEHNNVIKRIVLNSYKNEALSTVLNIMPEAKSVQVCFSNDENNCECYYCNKSVEEN